MGSLDRIRASWDIYAENWKKAVPLMGVVLGVTIFFFLFTYVLILALQVSMMYNSSPTPVILGAVVAGILIIYGLMIVFFPPVFPAIAEIMRGGAGGFAGYWKVFKEDWKPLLLTQLLLMIVSIAVFVPLVFVFAIIMFIPFLGCLLAPIWYLVIIIVSFAMGIIATLAHLSVRFERNGPVAALKRAYRVMVDNAREVSVGALALLLLSVVVSFIPLVGYVAATLVLQPCWIFYLASILFDTPEYRDRAAGVIRFEDGDTLGENVYREA